MNPQISKATDRHFVPDQTLFSPVVIAPTFNNDRTVGQVLRRVMGIGVPLVVIDDGSNDRTREILSGLESSKERTAAITVVRHEHNRGKAAGLHTGFRAGLSLGHTHAITIDTDGQHDPEQIPGLIEISRQDPSALVIGVRSPDIKGYPTRSMIGRRFSNRMIRFECGVRVADSQCGLRVYPLRFTERVSCRSARFNYETEIITRAGWAGCRIIEAPIVSRYLPPGQRVSHFRPCLDTLRSIAMHTRLVGETLTRRFRRTGTTPRAIKHTHEHFMDGYTQPLNAPKPMSS